MLLCSLFVVLCESLEGSWIGSLKRLDAFPVALALCASTVFFAALAVDTYGFIAAALAFLPELTVHRFSPRYLALAAYCIPGMICPSRSAGISLVQYQIPDRNRLSQLRGMLTSITTRFSRLVRWRFCVWSKAQGESERLCNQTAFRLAFGEAQLTKIPLWAMAKAERLVVAWYRSIYLPPALEISYNITR